jgi:hypothetical protein
MCIVGMVGIGLINTNQVIIGILHGVVYIQNFVINNNI